MTADPARKLEPRANPPLRVIDTQAEFLQHARNVLTNAEYEVIRLRAAGMRTTHIALALSITQKAVHTRIARARRKLKRAAKETP